MIDNTVITAAYKFNTAQRQFREVAAHELSAMVDGVALDPKSFKGGR